MPWARVDWLVSARWTGLAAAAAAMVSVAVSQSLLGIAVACLLLSRQRWRLPAGSGWLFLFCFWTVVSLLANGHPLDGLPQIRKCYVWLLLFVLLSAMRGAEDFRILLLAWTGLGSLAALRGLWQFYGKWQAAEQAGLDFYQSYVGARITGFMSHWMTFGSQMLFALVAATALLLFARAGRRMRLALAFALPLLGAALILGFTRGIWLAAAAAAVYLLFFWRRWMVVCLPLAAAVAVAAGPDAVRARLTSLFKPHGTTDSNLHRVVTWRTGLRMIQSHPLFGVGPEQVGPRFEAYLPPDVSRPLPEGWYGHLHNSYLQYAAERGIPAAVFLLLFLVAQPREWLRGFRSSNMPPWAFHAAMSLLIGVLVTGLFEYNLGDSEVLALTVAALAGAGAANSDLQVRF